jgi:putative redox protein
MKQATATRRSGFRHTVTMRQHETTVDEPQDKGGTDEGPTPLELLAGSLASCVAITVEMYATRKGWDVGTLEVECSFTAAERGAPTKFDVVLRLPDSLSDEQVERLRVIAAKCPVHRTLEGEVMFDERVERVTLAS